MGADELDVDGLESVSHRDDEPIVVALDVEHHAVVTDETGAGVTMANVLRRAPDGVLGFVVPRLQGLFGWRAQKSLKVPTARTFMAPC